MSLQRVKVSREDVLKIVQENKTKHDDILSGAVDGYWIEAESFLKKFEKEESDKINKNHREHLKKLRKARKDALKLLKTNTKNDLELVKAKDKSKGFIYWRGAYPVDHGDDYVGTIRRLELCVEPQIELDSNEFDSYIRNKWSWREQFIVANNSYVTSYMGTGSYAIKSAACNPAVFSVSSSYASF